MVNMKRIALLSTTTIFVAALAVSMAGAQNAPLGDTARQVRKQKAQQAPASKTFDNDTIPKDTKLSVVGQAPSPTADAAAPADGNAATGDAAAPGNAATPGQAQGSADQKSPAEEEQSKKQEMYKDWQAKIHGQQDKIDLATRELDVMNREYRLRAAAFYADAGNRLRNSGSWDKEDAQYKDQIAAKQKALDDAKKGLEDMQEEARKAGVPSSMRE
jgi:hypothetical protein